VRGARIDFRTARENSRGKTVRVDCETYASPRSDRKTSVAVIHRIDPRLFTRIRQMFETFVYSEQSSVKYNNWIKKYRVRTTYYRRHVRFYTIAFKIVLVKTIRVMKLFSFGWSSCYTCLKYVTCTEIRSGENSVKFRKALSVHCVYMQYPKLLG